MTLPLIQEPTRASHKFLDSLLGGLGQGVQQGFQDAFAQKQKQKGWENILGQQASPLNEEEKDEAFRNLASQYEQFSGEEATPEVLDQLWGMLSPEQERAESSFSPFTLSDEKIIQAEHMGLLDKNIANQLLEMKKTQSKEAREERKFAQEETKPLKEEIRRIRNDLPTSQIALEMIDDALGQAENWSAFQDFLAEKTGFEGFRSGSGKLLDSAIKQYFLGDLSSVKGGRPNVLIEKTLLNAYPRTGNDPIANRIIFRGMQFKENMLKAKQDVFDALQEEYAAKGKYLPYDAERIVNKRLKPIYEKMEKELVRDLQHLNKLSKQTYRSYEKQLKPGEALMLDQEGKPFAINKDELSEAKEKGYLRIK